MLTDLVGKHLATSVDPLPKNPSLDGNQLLSGSSFASRFFEVQEVHVAAGIAGYDQL